jgi:MtN3 and saliva related transmembrane protein
MKKGRDHAMRRQAAQQVVRSRASRPCHGAHWRAICHTPPDLRSGAKLHQGTDVYPGTIEFVGMIAGVMTTGAFFPQAVKTIRTRQTTGLSLVMYLMLVSGVTMWLAYGVLIGSLPLILSNAVVLVPQVVILMLLLVQRWREGR